MTLEQSEIAPEPMWSVVQRCREHLGALRVLAFLYSRNLIVADAAVVDAVVGFGAHPPPVAFTPVMVWRMLAAHIDAQYRQTETSASASHTSGLSDPQRQFLALVAAGRQARDVAGFLGLPVADVYSDVRDGLHALRIDLGLGTAA